MKTRRFLATAVLIAGSFVSGAYSEEPSGPPPPAPPLVEGENVPAVQQPANQIIYSQRLPTAQELSNAAARQGLIIVRIEQTAAQVSVSYKGTNGQITTVFYQILPQGNPTGSTLVLPSTPAPAVAYAAAPSRVIYYDYDPYYYYPWYGFGYPSISVGFGLGHGFRGGFHGRSFYGGSFRGGGFHHGHR